MGYISRSNAEIDTDLDRIIAKGFTSVKVYHNPLTSNTLDTCVNIVERAKAKGLHVVWTENNDNTTLTAANWSTYTAAVISDASSANNAGADEFLVGNEMSIHNNGDSMFDDGTFEGHIKDLVSDCAGNFPRIKGYEEGWWKKDTWSNSGLGSVAKIYFTLYENMADFTSHANDIWSKFGKRAIIGEWSTQSTMAESSSGESDWSTQLLNRRSVLRGIGISRYVFCYRDTGANNNNMGFGLWKYTVDEPHDIWNNW